MNRLVFFIWFVAGIAYSGTDNLTDQEDLINKSDSMKEMLFQESLSQKQAFETLQSKLNSLKEQFGDIRNQEGTDHLKYNKISDLWKILIDDSFELPDETTNHLSEGLLNPEYLDPDLPDRQYILSLHQNIIKQSKASTDTIEHLYYSVLDQISAYRAELLKK